MIRRSTRALVLERDGGICQWCGATVGADYSLQHRRSRSMGGSRRPETDGASNLITVHGSGTTLCHGHIESHREESRMRGFTLFQGDEPAHVAVLLWTGVWVFLEPDGGITRAFPPEI